jgi:hypothetical protein
MFPPTPVNPSILNNDSEVPTADNGEADSVTRCATLTPPARKLCTLLSDVHCVASLELAPIDTRWLTPTADKGEPTTVTDMPPVAAPFVAIAELTTPWS